MPVTLPLRGLRQEGSCDLTTILDQVPGQPGIQNQLTSDCYRDALLAIKHNTETNIFIETSLSTSSFAESTNVCTYTILGFGQALKFHH